MCQVRVKETNESEPLMTYRKAIQLSSKLGGVVGPGQVRMGSAYRPNGDRYRSGVNLTQAFVWNVGTCRPYVKGKVRRTIIQKNESTNGGHRGGVTYSSVEVYENARSKEVTLISGTSKSTGNRRSL